MADIEKWSLKRSVQYFDADNVTTASAHLLECPRGHPLVFRARPMGSSRYAGALDCHECPEIEGRYAVYDLPPDLG
jgi:hypothetical protein